jgi:hypothetical protein
MKYEYTLSNEQRLFLLRALNYTKDGWGLNVKTKRFIQNILELNVYYESDRYDLTRLTEMIDTDEYYSEFMEFLI